MRKRLWVITFLVAVMLVVSGCNLFTAKSVNTSLKLTLKDGTPFSNQELKVLAAKDGKTVITVKTNQDGIAKAYLKPGEYKVQSNIVRDIGSGVTVNQAISVTKGKESELFEIKIGNTGRLDIEVKDKEGKIIPNTKVKILDETGKLIKEIDTPEGTANVIIEAGKTYKIESSVNEFVSTQSSILIEEKKQGLVSSILISTFVGTVTTTAGVNIPDALVKVGNFSGRTNEEGSFTIIQDKEISDVLVEWDNYSKKFPAVDLTLVQNFALEFGIIDTILQTNITLSNNENTIVLQPNENGVIKDKVPNGTYTVTIDLPHYHHVKENFVVDGQNIKLARYFKTIGDFGDAKVGKFLDTNGVFKANTLENNYAILASKEKYGDATFYVEVHAPDHRFMIQMRGQMSQAAFWTSSYSFDIVHPVVEFLALRKYPNTSAPSIDLRSTDKVGDDFRNPTTYQAGDNVAIISKAYGDKYSIDMIKKDNNSLLWHEEFTDSEWATGHLLICTQNKADKTPSEFSNVTVLF